MTYWFELNYWLKILNDIVYSINFIFSVSAKAIQKQQNSPRNINFSVKRLSVNESTSGEILQPKSSQLIQRKSFVSCDLTKSYQMVDITAAHRPNIS